MKVLKICFQYPSRAINIMQGEWLLSKTNISNLLLAKIHNMKVCMGLFESHIWGKAQSFPFTLINCWGKLMCYYPLKLTRNLHNLLSKKEQRLGIMVSSKLKRNYLYCPWPLHGNGLGCRMEMLSISS